MIESGGNRTQEGALRSERSD